MRLITITLSTAVAAALLTAGCGAVPETAAAPEASTAAQQSGSPGSGGPAKTHVKRWTTVATLSGTTNKRGTSFHLGDGDKRLTYTVTDTSGFGALTVGIYVIPKGDSLDKDGGFPEVMPDKSGKGSTQLAQDAGDYYLDVQAANARWSVKVQEKR
jgi:hypothetical protein